MPELDEDNTRRKLVQITKRTLTRHLVLPDITETNIQEYININIKLMEK